METRSISRRKLLSHSLLGLAGVTAVKSFAAPVCRPTLPQGQGPYYPEGDLNRDNDLTRLEADGVLATGQEILVRGQVSDTSCRPVAGALVEIWQACASGKYNHSDDTNPLPLDPEFQYWGRTLTAADGSYVFKSIIPGHYPIGGGRFRPPHIHFRVNARRFQTLTTQMYFDPRTYDDAALAQTVDNLNRLEGVASSLKVHFTGGTFAVKEGTFDLTVRPQ